jgi:hypothetical protein
LLVDSFAQKVQHELRPRTPEQALRLVAGSVDPELGWIAPLAAVIEAARESGMHSVELEVVDANERAMQLYERLGFRRVCTLPTGLLTAHGGYRGVHFMRLDVTAHRNGPCAPDGHTGAREPRQ